MRRRIALTGIAFISLVLPLTSLASPRISGAKFGHPGTSTKPVTPAPVISLASGTYKGPQTVTLTDSNSSAVIYYTINGSAPNTSSTVYKGALTISTNSTLKAIAVASGDTASSAVSAVYSFSTSAPAIGPAAGTYLSAQTVTITAPDANSVIYYTGNGSNPTIYSTKYAGPFTVSANETVEAIAVVTGHNPSSVTSAAYTIELPAPAPTFSPAPGTYVKTQSVSISCSLKTTTIYYTTDGSTPTTKSAVYTGPLTVSSNEKISALALAPGGSNSPVSSASYVITPAAAQPAFSPAPGKYTSVQTVTISDATSGAAIYYTTDGSTPTASSSLYKSPLTVSATETIKAVALASGGSLGPVLSGGYTITLPTAVPVISPASGTYNSIQSVTISDATPGAVIYYTVNGKYPTTSSPVYNGPISAPTNTTIQAIAAAPNGSPSGGAQTQYTVVAPPPTISPASGSFEYSATVTMFSSVPGAVIHYTTNGSAPTASSPVYTGPISLSPTQTTEEQFQAMVVAPGFTSSSTSLSAFSITLPSGVLARATVSTTPSMPIPANFLGLSADYHTTYAIAGQASSGVNQVFRNLLSNLTAYSTAPLLFRLEADGSTAAELQPVVEPLAELAQHVNVNYTLGVDLMGNNLSNAEQEVTQWINGIPNNAIQAIEIGNEPDNYSYQGARSSSWGFAQYLAQFQQWQAGIQAAAGSQFGVMGPSAAGSAWSASSQSALADGTMTPTIISQHAYMGQAPTGQTLAPDVLLQPASATKLPSIYGKYALAAHQMGLKYRMGEMNSISGGGAAGISDTFQSSLWSIDIMFNYLSNGMDGVNWHSGQYTAYELWEFAPKTYNGQTTFNLTSINPLYYGLLAFAQVAGKDASLLPVKTMSDSNVSIWATVDSTSTAHVVVINKDEKATGDVLITLPGYTTGTVRYLTAASYTAKTGITLGGQTFDGTPDGTIQGRLVTSTITGEDGVFTLPSLPVTIAAIIDFTN